MPIQEPVFSPEGAPGEAIKYGIASGDAAQSWMDRTQQRQIREQEADQERQKFQILQPVMQAQAQANIATAQSTLQNAQAVQEFRKQAALAAPQAQAEFLDATQLADWDTQQSALGDLQAKYSWLANVPEYKPFIDNLNNSRGKAYQMALANNHIQGTLANNQLLMGGKEDLEQLKQDNMNLRAKLGATTKEDVANIGANAKTSNAQTGQETHINTAAIKEYGIAAENLEKQAAQLPPDQATPILARANQFRSKIDELQKHSAQSKGSTSFALPNQKVIQVGGNNYPVFTSPSTGRKFYQDEKGNMIELGTYPTQAPEDTAAQDPAVDESAQQ